MYTCGSEGPRILGIGLKHHKVPVSYAKYLQVLRILGVNAVLRTFALPFRHCTQATATAWRRFRLSGVGRRCPGSSEAGAILCHRSEGSMP